MIGRKKSQVKTEENVEPKGFDDFDLRLGDMMRGERATLGKSLLDVQRELRIRASYIAAIENADPSAFDTPGFIAGYVRSYARYLNMSPEKAFAAFCRESGFSTAHGMSAAASTIRKPDMDVATSGIGIGSDKDPFSKTNSGIAAMGESIMASVEPGAVGSALVLVALIGALGFGGYSVLNEVQQVQFAPVENAPNVLADLDPLQGATATQGTALASVNNVNTDATATGVFTPPSDALDRLYRPQALDVPVMVARDAPISTLDPTSIGAFAADGVSQVQTASAAPSAIEGNPQVLEIGTPPVTLFAVRPAWVQVKSADGSVIFEKVLDAGEEYILPQTEDAPTLRAGMTGYLYFELNGELYGPAGSGASTVRDVALSVAALQERYTAADLSQDPELAKVIQLVDAQEQIDSTEPQQ